MFGGLCFSVNGSLCCGLTNLFVLGAPRPERRRRAASSSTASRVAAAPEGALDSVQGDPPKLALFVTLSALEDVQKDEQDDRLVGTGF